MKHLSFIKKHLKNHSGDGYLWLLFLTLAFLLIFGALFLVMNNAMEMRSIRNNVDEAAEYVFKYVREDAYDKLTNGSTNYSYANLTDSQVAYIFAMYLGDDDNTQTPKSISHTNPDFNPDIFGNNIQVDPNNYTITRYNEKGKVDYLIENFYFDYIPSVLSATSSILGDVDHNGNINTNDLTLAQAFVEGDNPDGVVLADVDVNHDGVADLHDILMIKGLKKYWEAHAVKTSSGWTVSSDSAFIMISFRLTVPIRYGTVNFGNDVNDYTFYSDLSFKSAH